LRSWCDIAIVHRTIASAPNGAGTSRGAFACEIGNKCFNRGFDRGALTESRLVGYSV